MTGVPEVLQAAEWDSWSAHVVRAFGAEEPPEEGELTRRLNHPERSLLVRDAGRIVGTATSYPFRITVPGGRLVRAAGVSAISTAPTHRRSGVLRSLLRRQLDDLHARSGTPQAEPLAVLHASEPTIYGRFGYGLAARRMDAEIEADRVRLRLPDATDGVRLELVDEAAQVRAACEEVYAACVPTRPGMIERLPGWAELPLLDPPGERHGATPLACVLARRQGRITGYARYALRRNFRTRGIPQGTVLVRDLAALDAASTGALWRYLLSLDLMSTVRTGSLPVDDPLLELVDDLRRCAVLLRDDLFCRLVELDAALAARTYAASVDVVLAVQDDFCPWNSGRWRLSGDTHGAVCAPTGDAPDLALDARELGALYLGGTSLTALARAGLVRELRPGAVAQAATAFRSEPAPWSPHGF